jgi:hypothetical protein
MKDIDTVIVDPNVMTSCGLLIDRKPCPLPPWHTSGPHHIEDDPGYYPGRTITPATMLAPVTA